MAKKVKNKWLGARVDEDLEAEVSTYLKASNLNLGGLIRVSVKEYMINHPIKQPVKPTLEALKPGEEII